MTAIRFALATSLLAAGSAQAQLVEPTSKAFARVGAPVEAFYLRNETANPNDKSMEGFRTDRKLVAGLDLNRNLAIELGYAELLDQGFHKIDPGRPEELSGALGVKGFHSYLAGKLTVPVGDRLSASGKLGIAYSERKGAASGPGTEVDAGPYLSAGAKYRLNEKASVTGEVQRYGDTEKKWGSATNGNGVGAKLKLGF